MKRYNVNLFFLLSPGLYSRESLCSLKEYTSLGWPRKKGQIEMACLPLSHYSGRIKGGWICFPYFLLLGLNPSSVLFFHFLCYKDLNTHHQHWSAPMMESAKIISPICKTRGNTGSLECHPGVNRLLFSPRCRFHASWWMFDGVGQWRKGQRYSLNIPSHQMNILFLCTYLVLPSLNISKMLLKAE